MLRMVFSQNYDVRTKSDITAEQLDAKLQNRLEGNWSHFIEHRKNTVSMQNSLLLLPFMRVVTVVALLRDERITFLG